MFQALAMATCFKNIIKTYNITFNISIWIRNRIMNTSLYCKSDNNCQLVGCIDVINQSTVSNGAFNKDLSRVRIFQIGFNMQTILFDRYITVVIHIIYTNNSERTLHRYQLQG